MAAAVPLFGHQVYDRMGIHGAGSLVVGLATALALVPFVISRYGGPLRKRSAFAQRLSAQEYRKYTTHVSRAVSTNAHTS